MRMDWQSFSKVYRVKYHLNKGLICHEGGSLGVFLGYHLLREERVVRSIFIVLCFIF